jgi:hypothetical protein
MALIEISDRFHLFRRLAMQVWNEGYVPSFAGEDCLPEASECFDEVCALLLGNIVLHFFEINDIHTPARHSLAPRADIVIHLKEQAEIAVLNSVQMHTAENASKDGLTFAEFFDWGLYQPRPFEWITVKNGDGDELAVRLADVAGIYVDDTDES